MARHRSHSIEFKRQIAQEFLAGETLHGLAKRHDISRNLIRLWVERYQAGVFNEDAAAKMVKRFEEFSVIASFVAPSRARRLEYFQDNRPILIGHSRQHGRPPDTDHP